MTSQERLELRANIKFCMELGETPTDTYKKLQRIRGENAVFRALVFKWFRRFFEGRKSLEDDEGCGRRSSVKPSDVTSIEDIIKEDARVTVREISEVTGMSYGITKKLNMRK
ncbi:protein GVQW3-like, partial [Ruditapes philippinarum]|uniref:protein GVQW3-like n=1 Tax=Ruditapes philippinarum TaxID=129788 RepID=UPI00295AB785